MRALDKLSPAVERLVADMAETLGEGEAIKQCIRDATENLRRVTEPVWGNKTENIEYTNTLRNRVEKLLATLRKPSAKTAYLMFFAPEEGESRDAMMQEAQTQQAELTTTLERLRARCDKIIATKPGIHRRLGYRERYVATEARLLWEQHGKHPTLTEKFIGFAEQLFLATWRRGARNMKHACREMLKVPITTT